MHTAYRLLEHHNFDSDILARVADTAAYQNRFSFDELAEKLRVDPNPQKVPIGEDGRYIEGVEFTPRGDYDPSYARLYNISMANTVTKPLVMNMMRFFGADPSVRVIMAGNPAAPGHGGGTVTMAEAREMRAGSTLRPAAEPVLRFMGKRGITASAQMGYSYGADKAAAISGMARDFNHIVTHGVFIEPVSLAPQPRLRLGKRFVATGKYLPQYIAQTGSAPYQELRAKELGLKGKLMLAPYAAGLMRVTNRAIWSVLADGGYEDRLEAAVEANPEGHFTTVWGTDSELVDDRPMLHAMRAFQRNHPLGRNASFMRIDTMRHAGGDDIDLHTAILLQGLRKATAA